MNGQVEVTRPSGERVEFKLGDSFGADPVPTSQYHIGDMRTLVAVSEIASQLILIRIFSSNRLLHCRALIILNTLVSNYRSSVGEMLLGWKCERS